MFLFVFNLLFHPCFPMAIEVVQSNEHQNGTWACHYFDKCPSTIQMSIRDSSHSAQRGHERGVGLMVDVRNLSCCICAVPGCCT